MEFKANKLLDTKRIFNWQFTEPQTQYPATVPAGLKFIFQNIRHVSDLLVTGYYYGVVWYKATHAL
jgi:hypothetical protein